MMSPLILPSRRTVLSGIAALPLIVAPALVRAQPAALRTSAFATFADAVAAWARRGGTLIVDRDHVEMRPVTMDCVPGVAYRLTSDAPRRIAYGGPAFHWLFCIASRGGNPLVIDGAIEFDGRNACCLPFFARFEYVSGADRRDCTVSGLTARNARMQSGRSRINGSPTNAYGATAMMFSGGFDRLHLSRVGAFDVSRQAGAGLPGSQGCIGIGVTANLAGTQSARHVTIEDFEVSRVGSDDPVGPRRSDMDGVLVFQTAEATGTRPTIQRGVIREAAGRGVKVFAPGGGGVTRDLVIHRSVAGKQDGSIDVAHQHGDGVIENIRINYSGSAHATPTIPIGVSSGYLRARGFAYGETVVRNIVIDDMTGRTKRAILGLQYNEQDTSTRRYRLADISDNGSAEYLFLPGALGTYGDASISMERVSVNLTRGLLATEDVSSRLTLRARGLTNRNPRRVPVRTYYDGSPAVAGHRVRFDRDATVRGLLD